jgi:hypothetical protein
MWLYDTGEVKAIHVPEMNKTTLLDAFIYPLRAIREMARDGKICNQINGGNIASTEVTTRKLHGRKTA